MNKVAIICDFDGTITQDDVAIILLEKYGSPNWKKYDELLGEGKISLQECMIKQYGEIHATKDELSNYLKEKGQYDKIRKGFIDFVKYCEINNIKLIVVSAGIDFIIDDMLKYNKIKVDVISAKTQFNGGIKLKFPPIGDDARDFKQRVIIDLKRDGYKIISIGDAESDFNAARIADFVFAVKGRPLIKMLNESKKYRVKAFLSFYEIIDALKNIEDLI